MSRHTPMSCFRTLLPPRLVVAADDGVKPPLVYRVAARLEAQGLDHELALAGAIRAIAMHEAAGRRRAAADRFEAPDRPCIWEGVEYPTIRAASAATGITAQRIGRHLSRGRTSCG
jgi:hypothetical protein